MKVPTLTPGSRISRYEVIAHLASGGMGEVYRARDVELGRDVALKVLLGGLAVNPAAVERFRREARAAARLSHKNIVTLYDWGRDGDTHFLALELIDGIDLHSHIVVNGRLTPREARSIIVQAARALDHAFRQGITHRDIKPSNFLLSRNGRKWRVKLTDFGLALGATEDDFRVTRDGNTVGTIDYLSPEQARDSASADIRSDLYSLGCTLYHLLTGRPPFDGSLGERVYKHQQVEPPDVRQLNPAVSDQLCAVLRRMLAKRPEDRFQTPAELLEALVQIQTVEVATTPIKEPNGPGPDVLPSDPSQLPPHTHSSECTPTEIRGVSPEQRRRRLLAVERVPGDSNEPQRLAAVKFDLAQEALANPNPPLEDAFKLLLTCCQLDPAHLVYRRTLRQVGQELRLREGPANVSSRTELAPRIRFKAAMKTGDHRRILESGEELLAQSPEDLILHLVMAEAAAVLDLPELEIWLLEQAHQQDPIAARPLRRLARAYERQRDLGKALALWQQVRKLEPNNQEAMRRISSLLRKLARAYERQNDQEKANRVRRALEKINDASIKDPTTRRTEGS